MARPVDRIRIETAAGGFDAFQSLELVTDLLDVSTATFTIGDDSTWSELERVVAPGQDFRIYVNDLLQMTGRAEVNEVPGDAGEGSVLQLICRTKMADARYCSADQKLSLKGASLKDFVLKLYEQLGYTESEFAFAPAVDVDLMTGKRKGSPDPVDLEPIKLDQAKVNPPETIFTAAGRHLKRHHMMHWDGSDGRILVGAPDDEQEPRYRLLCKRGAASAGNNTLSTRRIKDWSEVASEVWVFGGTSAKDVTKASLRGVAVDLDVFSTAQNTGHFYRPVTITNEAVKTQAQADAQATRELAARAKRKDAWEVRVDGWSYWNGHELIPYAINATADIDVEVVGAAGAGRYLITRVVRSLDADAGAITALTLVAPGVFVI